MIQDTERPTQRMSQRETAILIEKRRIFRRWSQRPDSSSSDSDESANNQKKKRKSITKFNMFAGNEYSTDEKQATKETSLQFLKRLLHVSVTLTAWDFDSTALAQQLTLIDRDLFLKITPLELGVLVHQQSSKNAPNVAAMVAFSHRITCLVASDVLRNPCERTRARLIARFVGVAEKCHKMANFQSCRTVLLGLQCPAVYRLRITWAYVRKKHASKYQTFEFLCRLYRDPRLYLYQRTLLSSSRSNPHLPFIGDLIAKLLDRIPDYKIREKNLQRNSILEKLLSSMRVLNFEESTTALCDHYKPLNFYEDNRGKCLQESCEFLQKCQLSALNYNFVPNKLAGDYLLKARYKEERENFFHSLTLETVNLQ